MDVGTGSSGHQMYGRRQRSIDSLCPMYLRLFTTLVIACLSFSFAICQEAKKETAPKTEEKTEGKTDDKRSDEKTEKRSETEHSITLGGQKIEFTATAGTLPLKDAEGKTTADIFYIAYVKKGVSDAANRPLTFSFNGGPGSSSVWMHMGLLGPKRVKLRDDGFAVPPPYELVENQYSLLDETDLVFIDPVGTGYSRAAKPEDAKNFFGLQDRKSVV